MIFISWSTIALTSLALILLALAPVIYMLGRLAYSRPGKLKVVTGTIVAVALVALVVALTH